MFLSKNPPYYTHPFFQDWIRALHSPFRHTLNREFTLLGKGVHSGIECRVTCKPVCQPKGYVFNGLPLAHFQLTSSAFATALTGSNQEHNSAHPLTLSTPEHLLAALWSAGIDDVEIESSHTECPILDGSSWPWITQIQPCLTHSINPHSSTLFPRTLFMPKQTLSWSIQESTLTWSPHLPTETKALSVFPFPQFYIEWLPDLPCLNREHIQSSILTPYELLTRVIPARTFGWRSQEGFLRKKGLIKGVSNKNCCIFEDDGSVLTPLRDPDEPALHKILDLIGDLTLIGQGRISGRFEIKRGSHSLNHLCIEEMRLNSHLNSPFFLL